MKISYTKMRDELANVLEVLRSGEEVTITQRGKPDMVLNAQIPDAPKPIWRRTNSENKARVKEGDLIPLKGLDTGFPTEIIPIPGPYPLRERSSNLAPYGGGAKGMRSNNSSSGSHKSLTFSEAKTRTQKKHARIIKALEDK